MMDFGTARRIALLEIGLIMVYTYGNTNEILKGVFYV